MLARHSILALGTLLFAQHAAWAQSTERPWYIGAVQDFTHESNVLGTPTGEISDTISTTTLRGGLNQLFGRQRLRVDASLSHQRYQDTSERNNNGYSLGMVLDWDTIERLSGSLSASSQRHQTAFVVSGVTPVSLSNIERSDEINLVARLGGSSLLGLEGGIGHRQVRYSAVEYAAREYKQDRGNVGVVYRPSGILRLSAGVSGASTRYGAPEAGQTDPDRNKRSDIYVAANWVPSGASTIDVRLAYGKQEYDLSTAANFEGVTGTASWTWRPSGRLTLTSSLVRDSGQEASFQRVAVDEREPTLLTTDFSRITDRLSLGASYELTAKIGLTAGLGYARRSLVDRVTGATGSDNSTLVSLGARWNITRTVSLGCNVSRESRSASGVGATDMDNDRFGCFGSVTLD